MDLESFGKESFVKMAMEQFGYLLGKVPQNGPRVPKIFWPPAISRLLKKVASYKKEGAQVNFFRSKQLAKNILDKTRIFVGIRNTSAIENEGTPFPMTDIAPPRNQRNKNYKKKSMIIASINLNGLLKNIDEIKPLMDEGVHILAINETKLDNEISNEIVSLDSFELRRKDHNRHGGWVTIYIRGDVRYLERNDLPNHTLELVKKYDHFVVSLPVLSLGIGNPAIL